MSGSDARGGHAGDRAGRSMPSMNDGSRGSRNTTDAAGEYDDIIGLPHFHAPGHGFMPASERAAQFSPFKSLNSYHDLVKDTEKEIDEAVWEEVEESWQN